MDPEALKSQLRMEKKSTIENKLVEKVDPKMKLEKKKSERN